MKVYIAEDSHAVRQRLVQMFLEIDGIQIVGEGGSFQEVLEGVLSSRPDVLFLDIKMPGGTGLELLKAIKPLMPGLKVVVLSNQNKFFYSKASVQAGAELFLDKSHDFEKVGEVLKNLRGGLS